MREIKLDPLNTRVFKKQDGSFEITVGSVEKKTQTHTFKNVNFTVSYGEFSSYLAETITYL
jgi:hypothetical protein